MLPRLRPEAAIRTVLIATAAFVFHLTERSSKPASASPTGLVVVGDLIGEGSVQEQSVVGETPNLAAGLQALAAPDAVVIAGQPRSSERLPLTRPAGGTESSQAPRWSKGDANRRSR